MGFWMAFKTPIPEGFRRFVSKRDERAEAQISDIPETESPIDGSLEISSELIVPGGSVDEVYETIEKWAAGTEINLSDFAFKWQPEAVTSKISGSLLERIFNLF